MYCHAAFFMWLRSDGWRSRVTVQDILEYLAGGMSEDEILRDFSELNREDIRACPAFAADRERKLFVAPA